jgi:enoyl-CoA hydratase/carnithine racemase
VFGITPARLGIVYPAFAVDRAVRLLGPSATKHLLFSAELIGWERALRIGLVDEVYEPAAADERIDVFATLLATERSLLTQESSKAMVDECVRTGEISRATQARWGPSSRRALMPRRASPRSWSGDRRGSTGLGRRSECLSTVAHAQHRTANRRARDHASSRDGGGRELHRREQGREPALRQRPRA